MKIKIEIRRNSDNVIAVGFEDKDDYLLDNEFNYFWWKEGNGSCDCVRRIMFYEFLDIEMTEENKCSDVLFSVRVTDEDTREVLIDEFAESYFSIPKEPWGSGWSSGPTTFIE